MLTICAGLGILALIAWLLSWPLANATVKHPSSGLARHAWLLGCFLVLLAPLALLAIAIALANHFVGHTWISGVDQQMAEAIVIGILVVMLAALRGYCRDVYRKQIARTLDHALGGEDENARSLFKARRRFIESGERAQLQSALDTIFNGVGGAC